MVKTLNKYAKKVNLIGQVFSMLTVIEKMGLDNHSKRTWLCQCSCGKKIIVATGSLQSGHTKSCGCLRAQHINESLTTHGESRKGNTSVEYTTWANIKSRCSNPNYKQYKYYGGRGIKVCDRWLESFENFLSDMGRKPSPEHSLDRWPNNETGNYEPGNCRWGTDEQQRRNIRSNRWFEHNGIRMILIDWCKRWSIHCGAFKYHIDKKKKTFEETFNHFENKSKC